MITLPSTLTTVDQQHGYTSRGPTNRGQGRWSSRVVEIEHDVRKLGHRTLVVLLALRLPVTGLAWLVTGLAAGASAAFGVCFPRTCRYGRTSLRVASS
jgi:hypothetical protein